MMPLFWTTVVQTKAASFSTLDSRTCTGTFNKAGDTPLSLAYKGGYSEMVKYLAITRLCDTKSKNPVFDFSGNALYAWAFCGKIVIHIIMNMICINA